ncbi:3-hydroxyacyl-CoA dehydrogenase [Vibrio mediterranei]|uniref:3-hydroxyacyl-CoA dehydrogenase n=1 Tax=Vibrio mediterranei TaxID=689 RepID=UPI00148CD0D1|nr:3-hydroxyacyl-CoA dehydrogenase [Vibrio mediterranei]NOI23813.1 3-hydroxyacyl-CoA dehydrogenase [Vibrio mediterranei]
METKNVNEHRSKFTVAVVGAGLIGSGWALVFARAGYAVQVYDPSAEVRERTLQWAKESTKELKDTGLIPDPEGTLSRITVFDNLKDALEGASYVQESVFETVPSKTDVSLAIDELLDEGVVVGSSSSGIPSSEFTEKCKNRERFMVVHPVNPPHLIPVVEIVPAPWTDKNAISFVDELMNDVGQKTVCLTQEINGFVMNRLQGVLLNEAWALYEDGIASIADIDIAIAHGLGLRWAFMGPFETIDLNAPGGIEDYSYRLRDLYSGMSREPRGWSDEVIRKATDERRSALDINQLSERRAWRDAILGKLVAFKASQSLND